MTEEVMADVTRITENVMRALPRHIVQSLYEGNPVDTSHSRNNWVAQIGERWDGVDGSREAPSNSVQKSSLEALDSYRLEQGMIVVSNNVYYVIWLDLGHSPQASAGFIQRGIEQGIHDAVEEVFE